MVAIGLWLALLGYTLAYSGAIQLGGGTCSIGAALRGQCRPKAPLGPGQTQRDRAAAAQAQQASAVPAGPLPNQLVTP